MAIFNSYVKLPEGTPDGFLRSPVQSAGKRSEKSAGIRDQHLQEIEQKKTAKRAEAIAWIWMSSRVPAKTSPGCSPILI